MTKKKITIITVFYVVLAAALIWLDQWTKHLAVMHLKNGKVIPIFSDVFVLQYLENRGAAFGMLQNQKAFFIISGIVVLVILIFAFLKTFADVRFAKLRILLILIATGAIGNMIDRIRLNYVIDFFYFALIDFPIFNVADCYVTIATIIFILLWLFHFDSKELDFFFSFQLRKEEKTHE